MSTRIVCSVGDPETGKSMEILVQEGFDEVMHLAIPLQQAASALEARQKMIFTAEDGRRVFVRPDVVASIHEDTTA